MPTSRKFPILAVCILFAVLGGYYFKQRCLPRFRTVDRGVLYRSGQPRGLGLPAMRMYGIRTLVNLRSSQAEGASAERDYASTHGMNYHQIALGESAGSMNEAIDAVLAVIADPTNHPVLVHCSRGKERSGIISAAYRLEIDGWSEKETFAELHALGLEEGEMPTATTVLRARRTLLADNAVKSLAPIHWQE